jgi:hypothetical protein
MTFLDTKVVVRMVVTHLRNPVEGVASGTRPLSTKDTSGISSACRNVAADSNQNKQVIWEEHQYPASQPSLETYLCRKLGNAPSTTIY